MKLQDPRNERRIKDSPYSIHKDGYVISYVFSKPRIMKTQRRGYMEWLFLTINGKKGNYRIDQLMNEYWDTPKEVEHRNSANKVWISECDAIKEYRISRDLLISKVENNNGLYSVEELEYYKEHGRVPRHPLTAYNPENANRLTGWNSVGVT